MTMTHLRIELSSNNEIVTSSIITKLYELAYAGLDASSNLKGYITAPHAKRTHVEYLLNMYPELTINITGEYYVEFADPNTEKLLMSTYNISGEGICPGDITQNSIHNMDGFNGHPSITSFNELALFTSITKIASQGLLGQSQLTSIDLQNITGIDAYSFLGCTNLASLGDTSNITYIRNSAFEDCSSLTSFNFSNVTEIGNTAFKNTKITSVTLDNHVTLGNDVFAGCNSLLSVAMPEQTAIGAGVFENCTSLTTVTSPDLVYLGPKAFYNCSSLTSIDLSSLRIIDYYALYNCSSLSGDLVLTNINGQSNNTIENGSFYNTGYSTITLSSNDLVSIYQGNGSGKVLPISHCQNLTKINLEGCSALTRFGGATDCPNLKTVILPSLCNTFNYNAFYNSNQLESLVLQYDGVATLPTGNGQLDFITSSLGKIYVPDTYVNDYKTTYPYFASRIHGISELPS